MILSILFEDAEMLVLDKPAGITVNRSDTTGSEQTIQDLLEEYLHIKRPDVPVMQEIETEDGVALYKDAFYDRSGIVHRIDKETSGLLLIGKNPDSFYALQSQFKARTVTKKYIALAHGKVSPDVGEINAPVGRLPWNRRQFGVVAGGREALTLYRVKTLFQTKDKQKEMLSLVELEPKTGRTHQIRVHLKHINHPIFSDFLYAGRKTSREDRLILERVFLHAAEITFAHPTTGESKHFSNPLPVELQKTLDLFTKVL